jgi:thiamine kinase-like enzyme
VSTLSPEIADKIAALPLWRTRPRLCRLGGGISNLSLLAEAGGDRYVVRLTRDFPFHNVSRTREAAVSRAAHAAGFAPELVHAEPGLMVTRHLAARTLRPADMAAETPRLAALLRQFHVALPLTLGAPFDVFAVNRSYLDTLADRRVGAWAALNAQLEARQVRLPEVFAHHDLLAGNWLDDGTRLWLIDYEYAGPGAPLFDLGNLSSHAGFDGEQSRALLTAYFGATPSAELVAGHRVMEAASLLREALWSLVSAMHLSETGFDYATYAEDYLTRLDGALARL